MIVIYVQQCQWLSMILCERYVKIIHMCNNDYERLWKIPSRGKHWGLCCFLWEGSTDLGEKQMLVWFGNFFVRLSEANIKTEKGENKHSVEETEGRQQNIIGIILCQKVLLKMWEIILRLKVFGKRKHSPKDRCIGSKLLVLSSLLVLAHFFEIYILFLYQAW